MMLLIQYVHVIRYCASVKILFADEQSHQILENWYSVNNDETTVLHIIIIFTLQGEKKPLKIYLNKCTTKNSFLIKSLLLRLQIVYSF